MGRPTQAVSVKGSLSGKDVVSFSVYDQYGRKPKEYMPYVGATTTGQFQTNTTTSQAGFYNNPLTGVPQDTRPFTEYSFDGARVTSVTGPGQEWDDNNKSSSSIIKIYTSNTIRKWTINGSGNPVSTSSYPANLLVYSQSTDVNGQIMRTYKDQWGRVVLKEIENDTTDIQTYYAYDIRGNLLAIIPPKAVDLVRTTSSIWPVSTAIRDGLCYTNTYDTRGRLTEKRIPGKQVVYFVYDKWDRLVLSQDGNQRVGSPNRWTFTKYDAFSRPVVTGVYKTNSSRPSLQSTLDGFNGHHETKNGTSAGYSLNVTFPNSVTETDILAITYYDDYGFASGWTGYGFKSNVTGFTGVKSDNVKGQTTGSKTKILGTTNWLKAVTYYDIDYQPLQTIVQNHLGGTDVATTEYDYTGQILKTFYNHTSNNGSLTLLEEYEYDNAGRLINTFQTVENGTKKVLVSNNVYNEMGTQIERNLHSTNNGVSFLQSVDYRSNIRGWLTSMNNASLSSNGVNNDSNDLFGMELDYIGDEPSGSGGGPGGGGDPDIIIKPPLYVFNGNIASVQWQTNNLKDTPKKQIFGYTYDNLSRITSATFAVDNNGNWFNDQNFYSTSYTYKDAQGGFDKVTREGRLGESATTTIDDLTYSYFANSNQISKVDDAATDEGFTDGVQMPTEYTYDANGNMVSDQNAFITDITYNLLDKPERITLMPASGTIYLDFTYDAAGNKLSTTVSGPGTTETYTIDYVGGIHYINNELAYMLTPEGRILKYGSNYEYEYHLKDHLGNTRLTFGNLHDTQVFNATMEPEYSSTEEAQFVNINQTRDGINNRTKPDFTVINPSNSARVAKDMTGPGIAIPVQAGDNISAEVWAKFGNNQSSSGSAAIGGLLGSVANMFSITAGESPVIFNALSDALAVLASDWGNPSSNVPEAYINMVFISNNGLNTYMMYDGITASAYGNHEQLNVAYEASEAGVVYIYVANENSETGDVWFDDLLVVHEQTSSSLHVAQTNDYYPFGMVMAGTAYDDISRDAYCNCDSYSPSNPGGGPFGDPDAPNITLCNSLTKYNGLTNRYKFNGNEVLEGEGIPSSLNLMNFNARLYNPALGVFLAVDPYAASFAGMSPYMGFGNNPIIIADPNGEFWHIVIGAVVGGIVNTIIKGVNGQLNKPADWFAAFGIGAAAGAIGAATGGAAFAAAGGAAAGGGGFLAGMAGGAVGSAFAMPIQNIGNMAYFNDPMMTMKEYAMGILVGGAFGGAFNGIVAVRNGNGFWNGLPKNGLMQPVPAVQGVYKFKPMADPDDVAASQLKIQGAQTKPGNLPPTRPDNVNIGRGDFVGKRITTNKLTLSPKQANHFGSSATQGRSYLTKSPNSLLNDLNNGNFTAVGTNARGMPIVKFNYPIGNVIQQGTGSNLGATYYATIHVNKLGLVHIVPWLFR